MFNLVTTVLACVAMIAIGVAGLSYLGPVFGTASSRAVVAQVVSGVAQIDGASALSAADNGGIRPVDSSPGSGVADLVGTGYLSAVPAIPSVASPGAQWSITARQGRSRPVVTLELDEGKPATAAFCAELAKTKGFGCTTDLASVGVR